MGHCWTLLCILQKASFGSGQGCPAHSDIASYTTHLRHLLFCQIQEMFINIYFIHWKKVQPKHSQKQSAHSAADITAQMVPCWLGGWLRYILWRPPKTSQKLRFSQLSYQRGTIWAVPSTAQWADCFWEWWKSWVFQFCTKFAIPPLAIIAL